MRIIVLLLCVCCSRWLPAEPFAVGVTSDFSVEAFEDPVQVWLPENYVSTRKWPVMFYYHGTNGKPTIEFLRLLSGGHDWVLVGMGYRNKGQFEYTEANLNREIEVFETVYARVIENVSIDKTKVYVGGFSKGGWMTGLLLQRIPDLAGGMILGGGFLKASPGKIDPGDQVFIGVGELDGNLAMSYGARTAFGKGESSAILDVWTGLDHQLPNAFEADHTAKIRQWLMLQAGTMSQAEAIEWHDRELNKITELAETDKVAALHLLIDFSDMPFTSLVDKESRDLRLELQGRLRKDPALKNELLAWSAFQQAVSFEGRDRLVSTLAEALVYYQKLIDAYPDTTYGKKARLSRDRIKQQLGLE